MSMKRLGLLAAVSSPNALFPTANNNNNINNNSNITASAKSARAGGSLHGNVNVLLGGAMLSGVILVVFLICYCCHRNMRKSATRNAQYWHYEQETPLEVFTVDGQCYEVAGLFVSTDSCASLDTFTSPDTPSPPPAYDSVVIKHEDKMKEVKSEEVEIEFEKNADDKDGGRIDDNAGLPSYEAAVKIEADGYV